MYWVKTSSIFFVCGCRLVAGGGWRLLFHPNVFFLMIWLAGIIVVGVRIL